MLFCPLFRVDRWPYFRGQCLSPPCWTRVERRSPFCLIFLLHFFNLFHTRLLVFLRSLFGKLWSFHPSFYRHLLWLLTVSWHPLIAWNKACNTAPFTFVCADPYADPPTPWDAKSRSIDAKLLFEELGKWDSKLLVGELGKENKILSSSLLSSRWRHFPWHQIA